MFEKLVVANTMKKFSDFCGIQRLSFPIFLKPPKSSISTANLIHSTLFHYVSVRLILMTFCFLCLGRSSKFSFLFRFTDLTVYAFLAVS
jgi:hypothetical protein